MARKLMGSLILAMAVLFTASAPASAKEGRRVHVSFDLLFNGSTIASGDYRVIWATHSPATTVSFLRTNKVVATGEGQLVHREKKADHDAVVYETRSDGARALTEIRFAGSNDVLVFGVPSPTSMSNVPDASPPAVTEPSARNSAASGTAGKIQFLGKPRIKRPAATFAPEDPVMMLQQLRPLPRMPLMPPPPNHIIP